MAVSGGAGVPTEMRRMLRCDYPVLESGSTDPDDWNADVASAAGVLRAQLSRLATRGLVFEFPPAAARGTAAGGCRDVE